MTTAHRARANVFVFKPGGANGGNVYTEWAKMFAAIAKVAGPKKVYLDDSATTPIVIPVGTWDLTDVELIGLHAIPLTSKVAGPGTDLMTPVSVADGAVFTSSAPFEQVGGGIVLQRYVLRNLRIWSAGDTGPAPFTFNSATAFGVVELHSCAFGNPNGVGALLVAQAAPNQFTSIVAFDSIISDLGATVYDLTGNTTGNILLHGSSRLNSERVSADAASTLSVFIGSNDSDVLGAFPSVLGALNNIIQASGPVYDVKLEGTPNPALPGAIHRINTAGGPVAVNLPKSSLGTLGRPFTIIKATAEGVNALSFSPFAGDSILGTASTTTGHGCIQVVDNGDGTFSELINK